MQKIILKSADYWPADLLFQLIEKNSKYIIKRKNSGLYDYLIQDEKWDKKEFKPTLSCKDILYTVFKDKFYGTECLMESFDEYDYGDDGPISPKIHQEVCIDEMNLNEEFRSDPYVINYFEKLNNPNFKIIEIPDDIDWFVDSPCGSEFICQNHKYWTIEGEEHWLKQPGQPQGPKLPAVLSYCLVNK